MARFAVTAVGADRPGIVAAVTRALVDVGANLQDTEMAVLGGQFAMVLIGSAPDGSDVRAALTPVAARLGLLLGYAEIPPGPLPGPGGEEWSVTVYGADRPGIVHRIASLLADAGVNITSLETRVIGAADQPVYAMLLDVTVPPGADGGDVATRLVAAATDLGVECQMRPVDADVL